MMSEEPEFKPLEEAEDTIPSIKNKDFTLRPHKPVSPVGCVNQAFKIRHRKVKLSTVITFHTPLIQI